MEMSMSIQGVTDRKPVKGEKSSADLLGELLSFFYPVHYRLGMDLETVMCQGRISRKQAAILWLVHSQAREDGWVRRKEIERRLSTWFEISNSNISILLRELTKPPLSLLTQIENPKSGREKVVCLTEEGRTFVSSMIEASVRYLGEAFNHLTDRDLRQGVDFFELLFREPGTEE
jgi:DNA-binding MarR family transcriptional regulator